MSPEQITEKFVWMPELGMGYYPVEGAPYDEAYFQRYQKMADTDMGHALTKSRIDLVARHYSGTVVDVGIGSGQFVENRPDTKGFDVNPFGIAWLVRQNKFADIYARRYDALTFWDSLEHIRNPEKAISNARKWVFVSIPVFQDFDHIFCSRHFRPDEHYWYFTPAGIISWFLSQGFVLEESNNEETRLGRDSIGSYAFRRIRQ